MDFEMSSRYDADTQENYWDFTIKKGSLQVIDHNESEEQRAIMATFLQRGSIPQAPSVGNQWAEFLTGGVMPQELNAQIRNSIINLTGGIKFLPKYESKDGKLFVEVKKV